MENMRIIEEYLKFVINMMRPYVIVLFSITTTYMFFEFLLFLA